MFAVLEGAPHARDAVKGPELTPALRKFGAFVLNKGFEEIVAAMALHGHFEVADGEAVLDRVGVRRITTSVVPIAEAKPHRVATWGFTPDGTPVPLGWSDGMHIDGQLEAATAEIGAFLSNEKLTTVLAVMTRTAPFPVGQHEILFEQTHERDRVQVTTVVPRGSVPPEREAVWYFRCGNLLRTRGNIRPEDVVLVALRGCDPGC